MKEKSCGAVIYKKENNDYKFLLIYQNNGFWSFPKGHVEDNEIEEETAIREIKEETNLDVNLDNNFKHKIEYCIEHKNVMKEVVYFIATPKNEDIKPQLSEISEIKWLTYEEAMSIITYDNSKDILIKAMEYLNRK